MKTEGLERAKNLAALAALRAYSCTLEAALQEQGLTLEAALTALTGTRHIHQALMMDPTSGKAVLVRSEWAFTADDASILEALQALKAASAAGAA